MTFSKQPTRPAPEYSQLEDRVMLRASPAATWAGEDTPSNTQHDCAAPGADPQLLWRALSDFEQRLGGDEQAITLTAGGFAAASLALTVGYVYWTIKGGYLLASVLSQMPA
jgi:hypothetical protein